MKDNKSVPSSTSVFGRRLRERREVLGLAQEKIGVAIGLDESCARTRISRYELGVHEPPVRTAQLLATALKVPLAYLYCPEDEVAELLLFLDRLSPAERSALIKVVFDIRLDTVNGFI